MTVYKGSKLGGTTKGDPSIGNVITIFALSQRVPGHPLLFYPVRLLACRHQSKNRSHVFGRGSARPI